MPKWHRVHILVRLWVSQEAPAPSMPHLNNCRATLNNPPLDTSEVNATYCSVTTSLLYCWLGMFWWFIYSVTSTSRTSWFDWHQFFLSLIRICCLHWDFGAPDYCILTICLHILSGTVLLLVAEWQIAGLHSLGLGLFGVWSTEIWHTCYWRVKEKELYSTALWIVIF